MRAKYRDASLVFTAFAYATGCICLGIGVIMILFAADEHRTLFGTLILIAFSAGAVFVPSAIVAGLLLYLEEPKDLDYLRQ